MEEQARGIFSRFRRGKKAVETTMKVGDALADLGDTAEPKARRRERHGPKPAAEVGGDPDEANQAAENRAR